MRHLPLLVLTCAALFARRLRRLRLRVRREDARRAQARGQDLGAIKTYLLDHTKRLQADVAKLRENADAYHKLAASTDFDNKALLAEHRDEVAKLMTRRQGHLQARPTPPTRRWRASSPGCPSSPTTT